MNKKYIKEKALLQDSDDQKEINHICDIVFNVLQNLNLVNTDGIKPSDFPYELKRSFLREDILGKDLKDSFKQNVKINKDQFIVIKGAKDE